MVINVAEHKEYTMLLCYSIALVLGNFYSCWLVF